MQIPQRTHISSDSGQLAWSDGETQFFHPISFLPETELAALPEALGATAGASRAIYMGGKFSLMLTNHGSSPVLGTLYVLVPREDVDQAPDVAFSTGIFTLTGSATAYTDYGTRPGDSPLFRDRFRVVKAVEFCLAAGQTHIHKCKYDVKKLLDDLTESQTGTSNEYRTDWTVSFCVRVHGVAATNLAGSGDTTTAGGKLNYIWSKRHRVKFFTLDEGEDVVFATGLPAKATITERVFHEGATQAADVNTGN